MNNYAIDATFLQLLDHLFPQDLLEYFTITGIEETEHAKTGEKTVTISLDEKNSPPEIPEGHRDKRIVSKGFNHVQVVQDFPLRAHYCLLKIRTRRWEIEGAGKLERKLSFLPDSGLKLTTDFAVFLKEADRTRTGRGRTHRETVRGKETGEGVQE